MDLGLFRSRLARQEPKISWIKIGQWLSKLDGDFSACGLCHVIFQAVSDYFNHKYLDDVNFYVMFSKNCNMYITAGCVHFSHDRFLFDWTSFC